MSTYVYIFHLHVSRLQKNMKDVQLVCLYEISHNAMQIHSFQTHCIIEMVFTPYKEREHAPILQNSYFVTGI